jgi:hypothetical protein
VALMDHIPLYVWLWLIWMVIVTIGSAYMLFNDGGF